MVLLGILRESSNEPLSVLPVATKKMEVLKQKKGVGERERGFSEGGPCAADFLTSVMPSKVSRFKSGLTHFRQSRP